MIILSNGEVNEPDPTWQGKAANNPIAGITITCMIRGRCHRVPSCHRYIWLLDNELDTSTTPAKIRAMQTLGVPYPEGYDKIANSDLMKQADSIAANLKKDKIETPSNTEIIALIAYLQRMGTDIKAEPKQPVAENK